MSLYRVVRPAVIGLCRVLFRVRVRGLEHVPAAGAYVVAPTHRSLLDIPFTAFITRRRIRFMAKRELFASRLGARIWTALGGIPVDRGSPTARTALRACEEALRAGEPVAVFPEGTRHHGPRLGPLFDGAAWLAVRTGVPIVPVGIDGSEEILASGRSVPRLARVAVVVGEPVTVPDGATTRRRADLEALTGRLAVELQACFDAARALRDGAGGGGAASAPQHHAEEHRRHPGQRGDPLGGA